MEPSATEGHRYYFVRTTIKYPAMENPPIELDDWDGEEIPKSSLFVPFDESLGLTVALQPLVSPGFEDARSSHRCMH